jgi:hypothetical protein
MPDSKITALTALTAADPANDMFPIVDVSDPSMAASGTTKRISINNLLAASGTATLASATITGALGAAGLNVTGATIPANGVYLGSANNLSFSAASTLGMTLNSTGLGVGASPTQKFVCAGPRAYFAGGGAVYGIGIGFNTTRTAADQVFFLGATDSATPDLVFSGASGAALMRLDAAGNCGIGVTPNTWTVYKALQVQGASIFSTTGNDTGFGSNVYYDGGYKFRSASSDKATRYEQFGGSHSWHYTASAGTAGNTATFTQAMTLDASGNLLVGTTSGGTARLDIRTSASQRIINAFSTASGDSSTYGVYIGKFANDSTTAQRFIGFTINNDGAGSGQINANGASQAAFGTFSDSRLKENIVSLPSQLVNILSLRPVEFDYKDGSGHQIGFVAQEVQEVYSDAVSEQDGFLTVTGWSKTEARLVSAIKELAAKVQALEAKLA